MIADFNGQYRYLSNFWVCVNSLIILRGHNFPTVEHAFQYGKSDPKDKSARTVVIQEKILACPPQQAGKAKRCGKLMPLHPHWDEQIKVGLMVDLVAQKFKDPKLRHLLISTGDQEIVEGNTWHDNFWGNCTCPRFWGIPGHNMLGRILMFTRTHARSNSHLIY